jgi:DNA-binding PucR family transcriptional regulator
VVGQFAGQVVVLVQADVDVDALCRQILAQANGSGGVRIGVSAVQRGADSVARTHAQCVDALYISRRLDPEQAIARFDSLGYLHALYRAGADSLDSNPHVAGLRKLVHEQQADLFHTLEVYLDAGGNGVATAELLTIHRSTLNYRLARIAEICEVDLSDPMARTNLQVTLKLMRLFEVAPDAGIT